MDKSKKLIVLDRDGVINFDSKDYIKTANEWLPIPGSLEAIAALTAAAFIVVVVSNQSGIGRGMFTEDALSSIHRKMLHSVRNTGGVIDRIYFCPHHPEENCDCRKPKPGMLDKLASDLGISMTGVPVIGDKASDLEMARAVGARPILVLTGYGQSTEITTTDSSIERFADLAEAAEVLIGETRS
jgi:D-glycero-D-manno-heptose 1,7-bisphosphate phosphatase